MKKKNKKQTIVILITVMAITMLTSYCSADSPILNPQELARIGLKISWQSPLPLKSDETIDQFLMQNGRLYIVSNNNYVVSLRCQDGGTIFARSLAHPGFEISNWAHEGENLFTSIGNRLQAIIANSGTDIGWKDYDFNITTPPAFSATETYLAGNDQRIHAIERKNGTIKYGVGADQASSIMSVKAQPHGAIFASKSGEVISLNSEVFPQKYWEFKAEDAIVGPMVLDRDRLFFASRDTYVYQLRTAPKVEKRLVWKFQCAAQLDSPPHVTTDTVYQRVGYDGLVAIKKEDGTQRWFQPDAKTFLAQNGPWAYLLDRDCNIIVMDNDAGWAHLLAAPNIKHACTNTTDAEIYLADDQGRIVCLTPAHRN